MSALFAAALIPMLVTPVMPLIDFYNHLTRYFVLAHIGTDPTLQTYYRAHWTLLPDIGVDLLATPLLRFIPPLLAGKIIAMAICAILYSGVLYLNRVLTGQRSLLVAVLLLPLLYSYIFNFGFANFLLGLGLAFWAAGWWIAHRDRPRFAVPASCLFAVAIFFTHGLAFGLYGILVAALEVGLFFSASTRRPVDLLRSLSLVAAQAIVPLAFFAWWIVLRPHHVPLADAAVLAPQALDDGRPVGVAARILKRLIPILRVEEGPAYWFDIATFAIQALGIGFLMLRGRIAVVRAGWPLMIAALLTVGIGAPKLFGVSYITDRMPLFAVLCFLSALSVRPARWTFASRAVVLVLAATVAVRLVVVAVSFHEFGQGYQEFRTLARMIPKGSITVGVTVGNYFHETEVPRCEMYDPLLISQYGQVGPLFAYPDQQPLQLRGKLKQAVDALTAAFPLEKINDYNLYAQTAASVGFDYLMVCNADLMARPFPANVRVIAETPHFALLRAK
ncbi:MAG: hypothetical protein P4M15_10010 [Alphaproteobacteria bacterium]|nr:hypothetical protein [Alphaproteobacteria bacterium]